MRRGLGVGLVGVDSGVDVGFVGVGEACEIGTGWC